MSPDRPRPAASLEVVITDAAGRPLRRPSLARWLRSVAPSRAGGSVGVALVSDAAMRRLNLEYAGVNHATDVLSFSVEDVVAGRGGPPVAGATRRGAAARHLGDIAIATGVAARQARAAGHSLDTELRVLALHGLLHLLGYDHTVDDGAMAKLERRLRRKGGLREGLIDRARSRTRR